MPDYTYQASRVSEHSYAGDLVPVTLSTVEQAGPHPFRDDCPDHGVHTGLEIDEEIVVERDGDRYRLPDEYSISYCEECVGEHQTESRLLNADSVEEALEGDEDDVADAVLAIIELNWRHLRNAFRPEDPANEERVPVAGEGADHA